MLVVTEAEFMAINKMLMTYKVREKEKLLLRVFVNRFMIFIYKIIIVVSGNGRTKPSIEHKIHWIDNDYFMTDLLLNVLYVVYTMDYKK